MDPAVARLRRRRARLAAQQQRCLDMAARVGAMVARTEEAAARACSHQWRSYTEYYGDRHEYCVFCGLDAHKRRVLHLDMAQPPPPGPC